jgi:uncharacterized phage protein gp47/JayE
MACKIQRPDPQVLFDRYLNLFSTTVLGGANIIPESNEWYVSSINYAVAEEFYAISEQAWKSTDPREACCSDLIRMASIDGVYPFPATVAQGYVKLTGTVGAKLPTPLEFTVSGATFLTASSTAQPTEIGDDGTAVVRVRALIAGSIGNVVAATGTLATTVANVNKTVTVCGGTFCAGSNPESCAAFRARYLRRLQYQPRATNQWILDKLLEWPCSTRAMQRGGSCCACNDCAGKGGCEDCNCKDCGGALAFYVLFDNSFDCGIAPETVTDEIQTWMFGNPQGYGLGQVEVGICGRIVPVMPVMINVALDISGCPTSAQISSIRAVIREYFTTIAPSETAHVRIVNALVSGVLGENAEFDASFRLVTNTDGYGGNGLDFVAGTSKVFVGNCDFEPECDYMLCINTITVNRPDANGGAC